MRHLEFADGISSSSSSSLIKEGSVKAESLEIDIKEEFPAFNLEECGGLPISLLPSDDEFNSLELPLSPSSSSSDLIEDLPESAPARRNRRKPLQPQKAIPNEAGSSECSQDDSLFPSLETHILDRHKNLLMSDIDDDLELPDDDLLQDIDEENIFKGLQEETNGEKLDEEMLDNVKEEWRSHWGVKCNMCERVFPFKADFDEHYRLSYGSTPVYTCSFCNKSAEKYSTFRSHCYRHITEGRYKCKECPKGFSLQSMLHVHVLSRHTKAKPFACEECGKSFVTKPGLRIHLKKHKTETKEDYPCVECGKVLHTRGGLTSHMNVHRLGRRFMCDVCGKTFTQKVNMQQHVKQHTGDKPHTCDKCGKTFAERSHLARHYSFHSEIRPFKCDVCQKMYKTERCLKVHRLVHSSARPFVCTYCSKGFLSSTKLKQHHNIHTGERPFKCKYCERTFTNYPNWLKHTRRRHKVDHRTGEELEVKPKEEAPPTPLPAPSIDSQLSNDADSLFIDLNKADDFFLQPNLICPGFDDRFVIPQQIDLFSNGTTSNTLLQPNNSGLMSQSQLIANLQLNVGDFFPSPFLHTLQCD